MKKTLVLVSAAISLSAVAAPPAPTTYKFISTEQIVAMCKNKDNAQDQGYCSGFGQGVYDGYLQMLHPTKGQKRICIGQETKDSEIVPAFIKWTEANPKYNNKPASEAVLHFLDQRHPCKK
jgi:hypothetical protein